MVGTAVDFTVGTLEDLFVFFEEGFRDDNREGMAVGSLVYVGKLLGYAMGIKLDSKEGISVEGE